MGTVPSPEPYRLARAWVSASLTCLAAIATPLSAAESWRITPTLTVRGTATDNVDLTPDNRKLSDFLLEVAPGFRVVGTGGRIKVNAAYTGNIVVDARRSGRSDLLNSLDATATVEAVDQFLFVDFRGNVAQSVVSPFGARPTGEVSLTDNRTERRTFSVSPYVRGRLAGTTDYEVRYTLTDTRSGAGIDDARLRELSARIGGSSVFTRLLWAIEALDQRTAFSDGPDAEQQRGRLVLTYLIDRELQVHATAGAERNDFTTFDKVTRSTYGAGVRWRPTERTEASAQWERRFFGNAWDYGVRHRMPFLALSAFDRREVTSDADRLSRANTAIAYDLVFASLATRFPDPAERAIEAQRILREGGIPANLGLPVDFLTGGVFINRRQEISATLIGKRNTFAVSIYRNQRNVLDAGGVQSTFDRDVAERAASVALSHRLTPISAVTALASWRRTQGETSGNPESRQWEAHLLYTTELGRNLAATLEYRHVRGTSTVAFGDFSENALVGTLLVRF